MNFWVQSEFRGRLFAPPQFPGFVCDWKRVVFYLSIWKQVKQLYYIGCPLTASHKDAGTWDKHGSIGFSEKFWELAFSHSAWKWDKNNVIAPFSSTLLKWPQNPQARKMVHKTKKNISVFLLLIVAGFRVTERPQVLGFAWWSQSSEIRSQQSSVNLQSKWCDFCFWKKSCLGMSNTQHGNEMGGSKLTAWVANSWTEELCCPVVLWKDKGKWIQARKGDWI